MRRLLPGVTDARHRLAEQSQRLQARAEAFRVRKEVLKASFIAAESSLRVHETIAASGLPGDDGGRQQDDAARRSAQRKPGSPISPPRWSGNWARKPGRKA